MMQSQACIGHALTWKNSKTVAHAGMGSNGLAFLDPPIFTRDVARTQVPPYESLIRARVHFTRSRQGSNAVVVAKAVQGAEGVYAHELAAVLLPENHAEGPYDVILTSSGLHVCSSSSTYNFYEECAFPWSLVEDESRGSGFVSTLQIGVHRFSFGEATILGLE